MNTHDFYSLLDGKVALPELKNGIYDYPPHFLEEYNLTVELLNKEVLMVHALLEKMTELKKDQFQYTAGGEKQLKQLSRS